MRHEKVNKKKSSNRKYNLLTYKCLYKTKPLGILTLYNDNPDFIFKTKKFCRLYNLREE